MKYTHKNIKRVLKVARDMEVKSGVPTRRTPRDIKACYKDVYILREWSEEKNWSSFEKFLISGIKQCIEFEVQYMENKRLVEEDHRRWQEKMEMEYYHNK